MNRKKKPQESVTTLCILFNFQSLQHKDNGLIPKYLESTPAD